MDLKFFTIINVFLVLLLTSNDIPLEDLVNKKEQILGLVILLSLVLATQNIYKKKK